MSKQKITRAMWDRATNEISNDLESSKRHWSQVLSSARVRLAAEGDMPGGPADRARARHRKEIDQAENALYLLNRGIPVNIWTGEPL